jgi:nucleotide-binding universal stress UspA family protein
MGCNGTNVGESGVMVDWAGWQDRIVVGVDGSEAADAAVAWAAAEAKLRHCGMVLMATVVPPVVTSGFGTSFPPTMDLMGGLERSAQELLDETAKKCNGVDVLTRVEIGSASSVLIAASQSAALIVMGSRGRGGFTGLLLGSVGTQVAAHAQCPVAIIRSTPRSEAREIVVGIDESLAAQAALGFAFETADRHGYTVVAVHAWDIPAYDLLVIPNAPIPVPLGDVADDEIRLAAEILAGFRSEYPDVAVQERLVRSAPVDALLNAATNAAMIVVGTRGHGPAVGALLGSVSNGVLHKANLPVVVVPFIEPGRSAA